MNASTYANLQGTMAQSFRISKGGPSIIPGTLDPNAAAVTGKTGDVYIQYGTGNAPQVYVNAGTTSWQALSQNQTFTRIKVTTASFTATNAQYYLGVQSTGASIQLPAGVNNKNFVIKDELGTASPSNPITIIAAGSDTIDGQATFKLISPYASIQLVYGDEWHAL